MSRKCASTDDTNASTICLIDPSNHSLAVQGIEILLQDPSIRCQSISNYQSSDVPDTSGAVLILPLIENYISLYLDVIHCALDTGDDNVDKDKSSTNHSMLESPESISNSLKTFMEDGTITVNNIESNVLTVVRVLHLLVEYSEPVRKIILNGGTVINDSSNKQVGIYHMWLRSC